MWRERSGVAIVVALLVLMLIGGSCCDELANDELELNLLGVARRRKSS
jgi:hypothetical protein